MADQPLKTRFAPSPTGYLHLGNARTALFSALWAHALGGHFLLRVEDTDVARSRPEYVEALIEDLHWLGLAWEEGPGGLRAGDTDLYFQARRGSVYAALFADLLARGRAYACFCTATDLQAERAAQRAAGRPPRYSGRCRGLDGTDRARLRAAGGRPTLRFAMTDSEIVFHDEIRGLQRFLGADIGDFVIQRSDGSAAFFFSNAVDDALMGVTHVLRGEDHLTNTPRQLALLQALALPAPRYAHVGLIAGAEDAPLSKRQGDASLRSFRKAGWRPEALLNYLARLGRSGEAAALASFAELGAGFSVEAISRGPAHHDVAQLQHWQKLAVLAMHVADLRPWAAGALDTVPEGARDAFLAVVQDNVLFPEDVQSWAEAVYRMPTPTAEARAAIVAAGPQFFCAGARVFGETGQSVQDCWRALGAATGTRGKALFAPLRAALTGRLDGPELAHLLPLLPDGCAGRRLHRFCEDSHDPSDL